jgi:hypothetical protein
LSSVDYIKLSATARQIQETVFNRAKDNEVELSAEMVEVVMRAAIELALLAHLGEKR